MSTSRIQISLASLLLAVALVAVDIWLFRIGPLWGLIGLNVTKHITIAVLCQSLGVDRPSLPGPSLEPGQEPSSPSSRATDFSTRSNASP